MQAYAEEHGVDGIALRFTHVYGPGRQTQCFIREMIEDALVRRASRLPHGRRARRQYVYVTDVVDAIVLALDAGAPPRRAYNVGPGRQHSLAEAADTVRSVMGRDLGWRPKIGLPAGIAAYADFLRRRRGSE